MSSEILPPESKPPYVPPPEVKTVVHRSINLRVDLRVLAALGGTLIIIGALLPWVSTPFQPIVRVFAPPASGGWPIVLFGILAIALQFLPQFRVPRVSLPAAALGFAAGIMALASALGTISLGRTVIGEQVYSPLAGVGIGVYLTLAGSLIAILAGLAPQPPHQEPARAEIRLWKASTAVFASLIVLCGLGTVLFGSWLGGGGQAGQLGTSTPPAIDADILARPLINVEAESLGTEEPLQTVEPTQASGVLESSPTPFEFPTETPAPQATELIPTREPPTREPTLSLPPTPTASHTPTPIQSPLATPTQTATPTPTTTATTTATTTTTTTTTTTATTTPTGTATTTPTATATP